MFKQQSGGSQGLFTGRFSGYWNTGKGSARISYLVSYWPRLLAWRACVSPQPASGTTTLSTVYIDEPTCMQCNLITTRVPRNTTLVRSAACSERSSACVLPPYHTIPGSTWEGGVRQSAFAHWKGSIAPFGRSEEIVSSLDIFPTFTSLAGLELPDGKYESCMVLNYDIRRCAHSLCT